MDDTQYEHNPAIRTIRAKIQCFLDYVDGTFRLQELYEDLGAKTPEEKRAIRVGLSREKGRTVESTGSYGTWRKIDSAIKWFDLSDLAQNRLDRLEIEMSLNLHRIVDFLDGDMIGIEGVKGHGKTGFVLESGLRSQKYRQVNYISSELTLAGIQNRADESDTSLSSLKGIRYAYRRENFQDVIEPGAFNIIDWLGAPGLGDEPRYYSIPHLLSKIHDRMDGRGLTIVCLQKDPGKKVGDGGYKIRHKMNLALTLDRDAQGRYWANIQECKVKPELVGYRIQYEPKPFELIPKSDWIPPLT